MKRGAALAFACACACATPSSRPARLDELPAPPDDASAADLLQQSDAAWARRADPEQARVAEERALQALRKGAVVDGCIRALRAASHRIEQAAKSDRRALADAAVAQAGLCLREPPPDDGRRTYWLAVVLGQQTRERPSQAQAGLSRMVALLREAIAKAPEHDHAGPHRVLAMLLLRAPGWPVGPGDPDLALKEARAAVQLDSAYPPNHLAVAEALYKTDDKLGALGVYSRARDLAERAQAEGNPDAAGWIKEAQDGADLSAH